MLAIAAAGLTSACAASSAEALAPAPAPQAHQGSQPHVSGELLVRFDRGTPLATVEEILRGIGVRAEVERWFEVVPRLALLELPPGLPVAEAVELLEALPIVSYAEPNFLSRTSGTADDTYFPQQWALANAGTPGADVAAARAWDGVTGSPAIKLAIIDTGLAGSHPDIAPNYVNGIDLTKDPPVPSHTDAAGHGTMVAGVAGAMGNNGIGIAGVAWRIGLVGLKVDEGSGYLPVDKTLLALQYVDWAGIPVANIAFQHHGFSEAEYQAINALAGKTTVVVSAGNNGIDVDQYPIYPCSYAGETSRPAPLNLICVSSTDRYDQRVGDVNFGSRTIGISAPGLHVFTTWTPPEYYTVASGTSVAAPFVSAAAALVLQRFPGTTPYGIVKHLKETGDPLPTLNGYTQSGRRLNVWRAVGSPPPPEPPAGSAPQRSRCSKLRGAKRKRCVCKTRKRRKASRCSRRGPGKKVKARS